MKDFIEDNKLEIISLWGILMTIITIITLVYAVTITEISQDLVTTVSFKDQDIQDMTFHINDLTTENEQLKLDKKDLEYNFNHCVQELSHGD